MKKMKKVLSLILTVIMVLAMAVPAYAEPTTYQITINDAPEGYKYEAYQIFSGELYTKDNSIQLIDIEWGSGVDIEATNDEGMRLMEMLQANSAFASCLSAQDVADVLSNDTSKDNATAKAFADIVANYLKTVAGTGTADENDTCEISVSGAGYYLIKNEDNSITGDGSYTRFILEVVKDVDVTPKSTGTPTPGKTIDGEETSGDFEIGEEIPFVLTAKLPDAATYDEYTTYSLAFKDTLSAGLEYVEDSLEVYVGDSSTPLDYSNYTLTAPSDENNNTLSVLISDTKAEGITAQAGATIKVTYSAKLTSQAVVGNGMDKDNPGNSNELELVFSNNPNGTGTGTTTSTDVKVYTYQLKVNKVDEENQPLGGAKFVLAKEDPEISNNYLYATANADGKITGWTVSTLKTDPVPDGAHVWESAETGLLTITGLDADTYYLRETDAPDGYNKLDKDVEFTITATTSKTGVTELQITTETGKEDGTPSDGSVSMDVENKAGATLPSTGGIGTTVFYATGIILMAGAVFFVIRLRKTNN